MTITITQLPLQGTILDTTLIPVETAGITGHIAAASIKNYVSSASLTSITAITGTITSTLSASTLYAGDIHATSLNTSQDVVVGGNLIVYGYENVSGTSTFFSDIIDTSGNIRAPGANITIGNAQISGSATIGSIYATIMAPTQPFLTTLANITASNLTVTQTLTVGSNIVPTSNTSTVLGNVTNWFSNLYSVNAVHNTITVNAGGVQPSANSAINLGAASGGWYNTVYSTNAVHNTITVNHGGLQPSSNAVANIGSSTAWFNSIWGTSTHALYADLAEKYESDEQYAPGTVLVFGDETEVTISMKANDARVAGVVSTDPAYLMNGALENGVAVALQGRVPCKVIGAVKRGDLMVTSDSPGIAMVNNNPQIGTVIGKALGNHDGNGIGVIEVVVGRI